MSDEDDGPVFRIPDPWPEVGQFAIEQTVEFQRQFAETMLNAGLELDQQLGGDLIDRLDDVTGELDLAAMIKWRGENGRQIQHASENIEALLGYTPDELTDGTWSVMDLVHSDDRAQVRAALTELEAGETDTYRHEPYRIVTADDEIRWVKGYSTAAADPDDEAVYVAYLVDITAQKEIEARLETQRNALETLHRVLRHDIRNDLQLIETYADLLEDHVDDEGADFLDTIQESVGQAVELTDTTGKLADVMLQADVERRPVPLAENLSEEIENLRSTHPDATVTVEGSIPDCEVLADDMLDAVFRNILKNAVTHNDKDEPAVNVAAETDETVVRVTIADNGPGIPEEIRDALFSKGEKGEHSEGTGVGLYLVHSLVDGYGGEVWATPNESEGTEFVVELPLADDEN